MTIIKNKLLKFTTAFAVAATFGGALPAYAQEEGGGDYNGNDATVTQRGNKEIAAMSVAIHLGAARKPTVNFSLTAREIKQFNTLKGEARSRYLAKVMADRMGKFGDSRQISKAFSKSIGDSWCGSCQSVETRIDGGPEFRDGISAFITASF